MTRSDGFRIADLDTGLYSDPKVVRLARRLRDARECAIHVALFGALILESWASGTRVPLEDALPAWWVDDDVDEYARNLEAVGLIDADHRIPEDSWDDWFRPAWRRREDARAAGRRGNQLRWHPEVSRPDRDPIAAQSPTNRPFLPSVPTADAIACAICRQPISGPPSKMPDGTVAHPWCRQLPVGDVA